MKQSKKLLSMILAIIMVFSSVSIVASARAEWLDDAISYNSIDSAELTPEQYATAALDEVDRMLGEEQIVLTQDDIMVGELNLTSIDNALDSVNTILNGSLWTQFKGLLGDLSKLNISALTERRRSSTDTAVINSLLKFLYDNSSELLVPFIKGELDMGAIVAQFVPDINDLSVPDMLKEMLYKLAYPGQVVPSPVNVTVDKMVQDLINTTVAKEFPTFASYTDLLDLSAGSTYNSLDLGLKAIYNAWVVKKANQVWLPDLEEELMTNHADEVAKYKRYFNLNADGSFNFTIPQYTFTTDTFFSQLNNIIGSVVNAVLAPDLDFRWELGDNDMIVSNIINIGVEVLAATGDEFFASFVEVKTPEELDAMSDMEIVAYVARTIINSSVDGVWVPETADNLIKVANYTIKDIMAVNLPERDYSSNSAYPVDQINTIYKMLADFGVKALNDNPGLGLSYGIGVDELGKQALAWVIDEWGGLLSGISLNKNDSVWNNVDKLLKVILDNYSWFDATQFPSGTVSFESLVKDVLVSNILNLDFTPIFNLLANQPAGSELHKSPKEVLLRLVARTANLVFPGFIPTVTTFEALVTKNTLGNMVGALFTDLYSYRNTLVPAVVPIVCTALGLTTDQKFKTPDFDLEDFYYTSTANIDFKITNRSSGINTAYTDRNGVQHRDSRYSIKLESITCPDFTIGNISKPVLKGGESTTVKITGAVTGAKNTIVTVNYNVLTEDGSNLTSSPLTARIYTCISKNNTDEQTEWTTTSGTYIAKGGNTSIYGTDPELLDDLSFRIQNTTNASSTMTATSTGTSSAASKVVTDVSFVKLNPDSFTALAGGIATVKPYVLDGYEGTEEQKTEAFGTYGFQKYTQTVGVKGAATISKATNICLYNDHGLNDLFHKEVDAQRQASDYNSAAFAAYLTAMSAAAAVVQTPKIATGFINTRTPVAAAACPAAKYEAAATALEAAVEALEASATGGVTALQNYIDTIEPSNDGIEYDEAGYSFFSAANYKTYTWSNYREESREANSFVDHYTTADEETGVTPIPTALDVAYKQHRLSLYYGRLLPVATVKTQLNRAISEAAAKGFVESDYTAESWNNYQRAVNFANATKNDASAVQNKVNTAYIELIEGQKRLIKVGGEDEEVTITTVAQNPGNASKAPVLVENSAGEKLLLGVYPESSGIEIADYFNVQGGTATFDYNRIATDEVVTVKDGSGNTILTFKIVMLGDVDKSGDVTPTDAATVSQVGVGLASFSDTSDSSFDYAADVDNSGDVTPSDAATVAQAGAGATDIDYSNVG